MVASFPEAVNDILHVAAGSVKVTDAVAAQPAVISSVTVTVNIPPARPLIACVGAALSHK